MITYFFYQNFIKGLRFSCAVYVWKVQKKIMISQNLVSFLKKHSIGCNFYVGTAQNKIWIQFLICLCIINKHNNLLDKPPSKSKRKMLPKLILSHVLHFEAWIKVALSVMHARSFISTPLYLRFWNFEYCLYINFWSHKTT